MWSPLRYLAAVARGIVAAGRWWHRWVAVRDYREATEQAENWPTSSSRSEH